MPAPLSMDLRQRIVARYQRGGVSPQALADAFGVDPSSVRRLLKRYTETGSVEPRSHSGGRPPKIKELGRAWLLHFVLHHPDLTTYEYADAYNRWSGEKLHRSIVLRAIRDLGFTRKKSQSWRLSATASESKPPAGPTKKPSPKSNVRVLFLWTKRALTSH